VEKNYWIYLPTCLLIFSIKESMVVHYASSHTHAITDIGMPDECSNLFSLTLVYFFHC
jgi:hypothetical protein